VPGGAVVGICLVELQEILNKLNLTKIPETFLIDSGSILIPEIKNSYFL